jgi:hypothetical protein
MQAQLNMLSDPVTGLRRRPGAEYAKHWTSASSTTDSVVAWYTDIAGIPVHVVLNCATGSITILNAAYTVLATVAGGSYLTTSNKANIRVATVGDEFFLCNIEKQPALGAPVASAATTRYGFFYIAAGAFSKEYTVQVTTSVGTINATFTTPNGSGAGDATTASPNNIATQLRNQLDAAKATAGISTVTVTEAYVLIVASGGTTDTVVTSSTGPGFVQVSKDSYVTSAGLLPAKLPAAADTYTVRVGDIRSPQYYKYDSTSTAWLESGDEVSPGSITNMPVALTFDGTNWVLDAAAYEGRAAGDDTSNPAHRFTTKGITGITSIQGRFAILSGPLVSLSASNKPRRFFRSTVTSIVDDDPIEIGSGASTSASYSYGIEFNRDLILISSAHQAIMPGGAVITPRTANVVTTSSHAADVTCPPLKAGRTVMYPVPRSKDFFGVFEMVPSQYTDSQYMSMDTTQHIPKYMEGRCRFTASSGVSGLALFGSSVNKKQITVHEYVWDADTKQQQAWHTWEFEHDVAYVYFSNEIINIVFVQNSTVVLAKIDPRIGTLNSNEERRPFLDLYQSLSIVDHVITPAAWLTTFDTAALDEVQVAVLTGDLAGSKVGFTKDGSTLVTVRSHPSGTVSVGWPFKSLFSPSQPIARDYKGEPISQGKFTVQRYVIHTTNSSPYIIVSTDTRDTSDDEAIDVGTVFWASEDLVLGSTPEADRSKAIVPSRTVSDRSVLDIYTEGLGELNIIGIDYVGKLSMKYKRR